MPPLATTSRLSLSWSLDALGLTNHPWSDEFPDAHPQRLFMARLERDALRKHLPVGLQQFS